MKREERTPMRERLNIFVTGASSGIGRATARELAGRGHRVFAGARRTAPLEELAGVNSLIVPTPIDVTDPASVRAAAATVGNETGGHGIDVLVNAAGYALVGPVETLPTEAIERQFATNVLGLLDVTRAFLPAMRERGAGRVINVSSLIGRFALPGLGAYAATKFALEALSDALRMELADFGVSVVLVAPTWVATDLAAASAQEMGGRTLAADGYEQVVARVGGYVADRVRRSPITPEQVARTIAEAAEAPRAKSRYAMPARNRLVVALMAALPDRRADRLKRRIVGLPAGAVPQAVRSGGRAPETRTP
jgi:NAD(P)-dependent dehydrogenase (short-subunit alcohol dehydrogenase family)